MAHHAQATAQAAAIATLEAAMAKYRLFSSIKQRDQMSRYAEDLAAAEPVVHTRNAITLEYDASRGVHKKKGAKGGAPISFALEPSTYQPAGTTMLPYRPLEGVRVYEVDVEDVAADAADGADAAAS